MSFKPSNLIYDSGYLGAAAASVDSGAIIPATYRLLEVYVIARTTQAALTSSYQLRFNNDSGSNYARQFVRGADLTASAFGSATETGFPAICAANTAGAAIYSTAVFHVPFYTGGSHNRTINWIDGHVADATANRVVNTQAGRWFSNATITRISIHAVSGNLDTGSRMIIIGK